MKLEELAERLKATENELAETKKRLKVVEDIEEIKQLTAKYINCICFGKFDLYGDFMDAFFSKNMSYDLARLSHPDEPPSIVKGRTDLKKFVEMLNTGHAGKSEATYVVHPLITVDGDKAKGNWVLYINYRYFRTGQPMYWVQTVFEPEYVRENERWKFNKIKARERLGVPGGEIPKEILGTD
jgi:hypothetical protein